MLIVLSEFLILFDGVDIATYWGLRLRNRNAHRFIIVEGGLNRRRERSDVIIMAECTAVARALRVMATRAVHEVHFLEVTREYSGI